jgi:SAM-dependent methyltransferase
MALETRGDLNPSVHSDAPRRIAISFRHSYSRRVESGFMQKYFSGKAILDIGYRGGDPDAVPITEDAVGIELDYPGYDGVHLPFPDESQDTVLAAHVLEHIPDYIPVLREWRRVLKIGGYLVVMVPHRDLYDRIPDLPSRWNGDHKRLYTPATLMREIEEALPVNGYRVRHLLDNDHGFNYARAPNEPIVGGHEIELVLQKIEPPVWSDHMRYPAEVQKAIEQLDSLIVQAVRTNLAQKGEGARLLSSLAPALTYFTPWSRLRRHFLDVNEAQLKEAVRPVLELVEFKAETYVSNHGDLQRAYQQGKVKDMRAHWLAAGYFEGRIGVQFNPVPR